MKTPFSIKYRPQIESGEYKVETRDGKPARILCWDKVDECGQYIVALVQYTPEHENIISVCEDGIYEGTYGHGYDLFLITPEPELSEFEIHLLDWLSSDTRGEIPMELMKEVVRNRAAELLSIARKELSKQIVDHTKEAYENGKAEALKGLPRWVPNRFDKHNYETCRAYLDTPRFLCYKDKMIDVSDLEKLPGFND